MKTLCVPIADSLKTLLDAYSKANGIHKKKVVELALDEYLRKSAPVAKATGAAATFDDHPSLR